MGSFPFEITYIAIAVMCGFMIAVMGIKMNSGIGSFREIRTFRKLAISGVMLAVEEIGWMLGNLIGYPRGVMIAFDMADLIVTAMAAYFWYCFIEEHLERLSNKRSSNLRRWIERIPFLLTVALNVSSPWTHWIFYAGENNEYIRGKLYLIHVICSTIYLFASLIRLIQFGRQGSVAVQKSADEMSFFTLLLMAGGCLQVVVGYAPFVTMALAFGLFFMFVTLQDLRITTDALTGLSNRMLLDTTLKNKIRNAESAPFYLFLADVNYFKRINDTYGHVTGDHALVHVANAIKMLGSKYKTLYVCRYCGDEFLMTLNQSEGISPEAFVQELQEIIAVRTPELEDTVSLTMSVGYCLVSETAVEAVDIIRQADQMLYEKKKNRS